jgi:hypothetical protein
MSSEQVKAPEVREPLEPVAPPAVLTQDGSRPSSRRLGRLPLIAFLTAIGLLLVSLADALSRATITESPLIYWTGLLLIGLPIFYRLVSKEASDGERLTLVCMLGMALYGVKLLRDSLLFTLPDEFVHSFNSEQIVDRHHMFHDVSIQPISAHYPGLEGAASSLMSLTGMSSFGSGVLVVGAARLLLLIGLFLLFRRISGSARAAGLGVAIYVGNFNFLIFGAQFAYESLALPLLVFVLMAVAEREAAPRDWARSWAVPVVLGTAAIVVTHHVTAYMLVVVLAAIALTQWVLEREIRWPNPWPFAALALGLAAVWLTFVATATAGYLTPVLQDAWTSLIHTISGQSSGRGLFQASSADSQDVAATAPFVARVVTFSSVLLLLAALPFGLWQAWLRHRRQAFAPILCLAAVGFFATLGLRFVPAAWETANRAAEFLFLGLAFVVALAIPLAYSRLEGRGPRSAPWLGRAVLAGGLGVVLCAGIISSWPWDAQMPSPVKADADGRTIEAEPLGVARFVSEEVPKGRFAASEADARLLIAPGNAWAESGNNPDIESLLLTSVLEPWQLPLLRDRNLRYVVTDRRRRSVDTTRGYSFSVTPAGGKPDTLLPRASQEKWELVRGATRIYDSGNIVIYDLKDLRAKR